MASFLASLHLGQTSVLQYLVFYFEVILFTWIYGASVGQNLMKLKVVTQGSEGRLSFLNVLIRTTLLMFVLPALFTAKGRGLHEIASKSEIVVTS